VKVASVMRQAANGKLRAIRDSRDRGEDPPSKEVSPRERSLYRHSLSYARVARRKLAARSIVYLVRVASEFRLRLPEP